MARRRRLAVYPPRRHRARWRIEIWDGVTGSRSRPSFGGEEDAWRGYKDALKEARLYEEPTLGELIELYLCHVTERGNRPASVATTGKRLRNFLRADALIVSQLTPKRCEAMYVRRRKEVKVDTHRNELAAVKAFCRWLVKEGHVKRSPAEAVEPIGRRRKGKKQLRPGEAVKLLNFALARSAEGDDAAFAAALALVMGLRSGEITRRVARDVDGHARLLYIENAKTEAGNRRVEIPDVLWPHFEARVEGKGPTDPLLPTDNTEDGFHRHEWLWKATRKMCLALDLPVVCPHGLRGTHSSLAQEAGATAYLVAQQLGHANTTVTREHYTAPGVTEQQTARRALKVLSGGQEN